MHRNLSLLLLAIAAAFVLGGGNTIQDKGKDVQKPGHTVEGKAVR